MAFIVKGRASCDRPGCGASWPRDPVLDVACPDCKAAIGVRCRRPSGHSGPFTELHNARDILADTVGAYGTCPLGICGLNKKPAQASFHF